MRQQIWAAMQRAQQCLLVTPTRYITVVTAEQYVWRWFTAKGIRTRVLGAFQQAAQAG